MQTVNFKCGHCGQVMAVGRENLGQQVRCPHCQQIVMAPASDSPAPVGPSPFGSLNEHEDIFVRKKETDDVLFGQAEGPKLELPRVREPDPSPPTLTANGMPAPGLAPLEPPHEATFSPTTLAGPAPFAHEAPTTAPAEQTHWSPSAESVQDRPAAARAAAGRQESFVSIPFLLMIFAPTLLWALGATGIAFWLFGKVSEAREQQQQSPFDNMIDDGENPGVKKDKAKVRAKLQTTEKFVTAPLPDHLRTTIGQPITVGDLKVTPLGVSKRVVSLVTANAPDQPHERRFESLVLDLEFENISSEYAFAPLDNYFDRQFKGIGLPPLTLVQAGDKVVYGGSHKWIDQAKASAKRDARPEARQFPFNRKQATSGLAPGQKARGYVCTDGDNEKTSEFLFGSKENKKEPYKGTMLWRVQVRKGPYFHKGQTLSATTVIGVEFMDKDVVAK